MMRQSGLRRCFTLPALVAVAGLLLSGCDTLESLYSDDSGKKKLPGERIAVLQTDSRATPDPALAATAVAVPPTVTNTEWPQAGGFPDHAMGNLALSGALKEVWRSSVGSGSGRGRPGPAPGPGS